MLIAAIILGCLSLLSLIVSIIRHFSDDDGGTFGLVSLILGIAWLICFLNCLNWQVSSKELTGYIYSSSDKAGFTTAHIRFSQNAGQDVQPEFCVKADSKPGHDIRNYIGNNTKVKIHIPSYFYFSNNPFACGTTNMTIQEVK